MPAENVFVFVVCGAKEHTDALHFSLQALHKFSKYDVIVLTDTSRNEEPVVHTNILDVKTPAHFNHHQASIYLKTGAHKFLRAGNNYCYLDTDVIAVDSKVDSVFEQFSAPVTFAPDHCVTDQFSPSAVTCNCAKEYNHWQHELKQLFNSHKDLVREPENAEKKKKLMQRLEEIKQDKWGYRLLSLRFNLASTIFKLDEDTFLNKKHHYWHDKQGRPILYERGIENSVEIIERTTNYRYVRDGTETWTMNGKNVFDCRCNHLKETIKRDFGIEVADEKWQHWNGGVFLFNDSSAEFLNSWHEKTITAFSLPGWKTRDQGTLIATAWQFNLQNHPTLSPAFNLIADYSHPNIEHKADLVFSFKKEGWEIHPVFLHAYHHWGDKRWDVWQAIEKITGIEIDPESQTFNALWIGKSLTKLELLTIQSFLSFDYRFRLWVYEPIETPLPKGVIVEDASQIISYEKLLSVLERRNQSRANNMIDFSRMFRYKLLYEKGGWWVDMDVSCLQPFESNQLYFFKKHHELKAADNVMKCPKNSELMETCYKETAELLTVENSTQHKLKNTFTKTISELRLEKHIHQKVSNSDNWKETNRFIWSDEQIPKEWLFVHWQNAEWRKNGVNRDDFYYPSALAKLMREHRLTEVPQSRIAEIINTIKHSSFMRRLFLLN